MRFEQLVFCAVSLQDAFSLFRSSAVQHMDLLVKNATNSTTPKPEPMPKDLDSDIEGALLFAKAPRQNGVSGTSLRRKSSEAPFGEIPDEAKPEDKEAKPEESKEAKPEGDKEAKPDEDKEAKPDEDKEAKPEDKEAKPEDGKSQEGKPEDGKSEEKKLNEVSFASIRSHRHPDWDTHRENVDLTTDDSLQRSREIGPVEDNDTKDEYEPTSDEEKQVKEDSEQADDGGESEEESFIQLGSQEQPRESGEADSAHHIVDEDEQHGAEEPTSGQASFSEDEPDDDGGDDDEHSFVQMLNHISLGQTRHLMKKYRAHILAQMGMKVTSKQVPMSDDDEEDAGEDQDLNFNADRYEGSNDEDSEEEDDINAETENTIYDEEPVEEPPKNAMSEEDKPERDVPGYQGEEQEA